MTALVLSFSVLLLLAMPIAFAMGIAGLLYLLLSERLPESILVQQTYAGTSNFILTAIPFFLLAGQLMNEGGITRRLVSFAQVLVGHMRGGLAQVNVLSSMLFAGVTGSAAADASAIGSVMIPAMKKQGYEADFAAAVTAGGAGCGPIIPPSIPMVVYGVAANVSIGALLLAGAVPGILLGLAQMAYVGVVSVRRNYPRGVRATLREAAAATGDAALALFMPLMIVVGISGGFFTATEAAAAACLYAFIVGAFIYGEIKLASLPRILFETGKLTGTVMIIVGVAKLIAWILALERVPQLVASLVLTWSDDPAIVLFLINVLLLIVGCFLETTAAIIILVPVLLPLVVQLGVDPIHFGVIVVLNLVLGLITPPVGISLYIVCSITRLSMERVFRALAPLLAVGIGVLMLVTYVPALSLALPRLIMPQSFGG